MKICVIGSGYVGLVTGTCLAELGNAIICIDKDRRRLETLKKGAVPFYEPGLKEMIRKNKTAGRISFSADLVKSVQNSEIIFIAVGTPPRKNGEADVSAVVSVAGGIALALRDWKRKSGDAYKIIVNKSTVPVGMGDIVTKKLLDQGIPQKDFAVVSNPEFLREGSAIYDFMHPDRIVIGAQTSRAFNTITELYRPLNAHIIFTSVKSAELIKYASNAFLATKISFINEIANICEKVGADVAEVANAIGLDKRIGRAFLNAGIGYGGSCLPKDISALLSLAKKTGFNPLVLSSVNETNKRQVQYFINKIVGKMGKIKKKKITMFGLSFKPETDDLRDAPSLEIIKRLAKMGAIITVYDPVFALGVKQPIIKGIKFSRSPYQAVQKADALLVATEWSEFAELDFESIKNAMKSAVVFDGRNVFNAARMRESGFEYYGIGR